MMDGIIWLASYPKAGNTWLRAFLTNYLLNQSEPVSINEFIQVPLAATRDFIDDILGTELSDLHQAEIDRYRSLCYTYYASSPQALTLGGFRFVKAHDAYTRLFDGGYLFPPEATRGVIYIVRNPLDLAVSYAHHFSTTVDQAVEDLCKPELSMATTSHGLAGQLRQRLLSWSAHFNTWNDAVRVSRLLLRYEDMKTDPTAAFEVVVRFLGLEVDQARLQRAISFSSFDVLKAQESKQGFREASQQKNAFFRKGAVGGWREHITPAHVEQIIKHHGEVMRRLGYLDEAGNLTI